MSRSTLRPVVKLRSTAGTGFTYVTRKNRRNDPDRLVIRKYDDKDGNKRTAVEIVANDMRMLKPKSGGGSSSSSSPRSTNGGGGNNDDFGGEDFESEIPF